jgi:hypothetical protein
VRARAIAHRSEGARSRTGIDPAPLECVRIRSIVAAAFIAAMFSTASAGIAIHATCVAEVARDPAHVRTLSSELARALAGVRAPTGYALDVSLVRVDVITADGEVEIQVEARAFVSDGKRRVRFSSTATATARGRARDRALVHRDALTSIADQLAALIRTRAR